MKTVVLVVLAASFTVSAEAQTADTSVREPVTNCFSAGGAPNTSTPKDVVVECEKRDVARLFLLAGKTEAALRVLCTTNSAKAAFGDDHSDGHNWVTSEVPNKCFAALGVK